MKTLNEIISKAFCINLYFSIDRWKNVEQQFAAAGLNVERFNAIDGKEFKNKYSIRPGNCGCNLSHFLIIQISSIMGFDAVLIFEDDVILMDNFVESINTCIADLPDDWDLLMLGGSHMEKPTPITDNIYRVNKSFCTHAYIVSSSMFEVLLERMKAFDQPMDCLLSELQKTRNVYITNPPMAWQAAGYSIIEEKQMDYPWLKTN